MYDSIEIKATGDVKNETARLRNLILEWLAEKGFAGGGREAYNLTFSFDAAVKGQGYRFTVSENAGTVSASCLAGMFAGAGYFLFNSGLSGGRLIPACKPTESYPALKVRGMYLATHFHNFYHEAPLPEVLRYVEELALWGFNTLNVWFDMHHYTGMDDPEAMRMVERLRGILLKAQEAGMSPCIGGIANEGFSTTPEELKADWRAGQNGYHSEPVGHYHVEVCPNAPGGTEFILKTREDMCRAFDGVNFKYVWVWPYDQGGCTCSKCAPWGSEGYIKTAPLVAEVFKRHFPDAEVVLSVWDFDEFVPGEIDGFKKSFKNENGYASYILCEPRGQYDSLPIKNGEIRGLPMIGFPEISMRHATPWGGFGANPLPRYIRHLWNVCRKDMQGGYPYSEGIYEDVNKYIVSRIYWHGDYDVKEALAEYARAYFSDDNADAIVRCLIEMEITLERHMVAGENAVNPFTNYLPEERVGHGVRNIIKTPAFCDDVYKTIKKCDDAMPREKRESWRWRVIYLRALIDRELVDNGYYETEALREAYMELIRIYHADNADFAVRPPIAE